jgi:predicted acyltransferase
MILVNNPGDWEHVYSPLLHAHWHGLTPTDLVFPFFLFAVGNAMAFVVPRLKEKGDGVFWRKVAIRSLVIFLIGLFLNAYPFSDWQDGHLVFRGWEWTDGDGNVAGLRIMGVLQRIAICYFVASILVYYTGARTAGLIGCLILLAYWVICIAMNRTDPYSIDGWFGTAIDKGLFGVPHIYHGEGVPFENEGLVSTIPAIVQVIFGYVVGDYIRQRGQTNDLVDARDAEQSSLRIYQTISVLFTSSVVMLAIGYLWSLDFPLNKKIQSSSFIVVTSGLALALLSTMVFFIDARKYNGLLVKFFSVFGKNALFIYVLSTVLGNTLAFVRIPAGTDDAGSTYYVTPLQWFYQNVCVRLLGESNGASLMYAVSLVLLLFLIGYWMDRKKIYVKV